MQKNKVVEIVDKRAKFPLQRIVIPPEKNRAVEHNSESALQFLRACQARVAVEIIHQIKDGADINCSVTHELQSGTYTHTAITAIIAGEQDAPSYLLPQARNQTFQLLDILLRAGADPNIGSKTTLALLSEISDSDEILEYLVSNGFRLAGQEAFNACLDSLLTGNLSKLKRLAQAGVDLNQRNADGNCPIHLALYMKAPLPAGVLARAGDPRAKQWCDYLQNLSEIGINIKAKDKFGMTLLMMALGTDQPDLAIGLVMAGLDPSEGEGLRAPVCMAAMHSGLETLKRLLEHGADSLQLAELPCSLVEKEVHLFAQSIIFLGAFTENNQQ